MHLNLNVLNQEFAFPKSGTATESETVPMERTKLTAVKRATKRIYSHVSIELITYSTFPTKLQTFWRSLESEPVGVRSSNLNQL